MLVSRAYSLLLLAGLLISTNALAIYPDVTGTYAGDRTQTRYGCTGPGSGGQEGTMNTRYREITLSNFDPVAGTFDVYVEGDDGAGGTNIRTGSGYYSSPTTIVRNVSGPTTDGLGTFTNSSNSTIGLDSTGAYVVGFGQSYGPGSSNGVIDKSASGSWTCNTSSTGNADRISGPPTVDSSAVAPAISPSNTVTSGAAMLGQVVTTTTAALGSRVQAALSGNRGGSRSGGFRKVGANYMLETPSGLSAGDTFKNLGIWTSYAYSDFENDFSRTKYDGDRHMVFAGADFTPREDMVLGLAVGYEDTSMDTDFNNGKLDADGWTIAPYFGMVLDETWSFDVSAGISDIDTDQNRRLTSTSALITSDVDTDRWFVSANINGFTQIDNWLLTGRAGLLNAESDDDRFTESNGTSVAKRSSLLTQINIGGEAAYAMDEFEPYISATYNYDTHATETNLVGGRQPSNDHDDVLLGLGLRYFSDNVSITTQLDTRAGRDDFDETTFSLTARFDF